MKTQKEQTSNSQYQYAKIYVKLRKSLKLTHLIVRLNAVSEEKSTVLLDKLAVLTSQCGKDNSHTSCFSFHILFNGNRTSPGAFPEL